MYSGSESWECIHRRVSSSTGSDVKQSPYRLHSFLYNKTAVYIGIETILIITPQLPLLVGGIDLIQSALTLPHISMADCIAVMVQHVHHNHSIHNYHYYHVDLRVSLHDIGLAPPTADSNYLVYKHFSENMQRGCYVHVQAPAAKAGGPRFDSRWFPWIFLLFQLSF